MGFSVDRAAEALLSSGGRIDEAVLSLTSPSPPTLASLSKALGSTDEPPVAAETETPQSRAVVRLRQLIDQVTPTISDICVSDVGPHL